MKPAGGRDRSAPTSASTTTTRSITGVGFRPGYVVIQADDDIAAAHKITVETSAVKMVWDDVLAIS